jgi:hypothetical protein
MPEKEENKDGYSSRPTYPAEEHCIPFRTIFDEYGVRRKADVEATIAKYLGLREAAEADDLWNVLDSSIAKSADAYDALAAMKEVVAYRGQQPGETDGQYSSRIKFGYDWILKAEAACKEADDPLKKALHEMHGSAVCLSGGGIRSASFSLGVLQGLARFSRSKPSSGAAKPLLDSLDYLSTVSGGGYIGSWLMAWAKRSSYQEVVKQLGSSAATSGDPEPQPIRHLREYTNYLSPRFGFTLDTLTLLSIVVRNMALNWLVIVPVVICLFCLPNLLWALSYGLPLSPSRYMAEWSPRAMYLATLCISIASIFIAWRSIKPAYSSEMRNPGKRGSATAEFWWLAMPMVLGAWLMGETWLRRGIWQPQHYYDELVGLYFFFTYIPLLVMSLVRLKELIYLDLRQDKDDSGKEEGEQFRQRWPLFEALFRRLRRLRFVTATAITEGRHKPTVFHKHGRLDWLRLGGFFLAPVFVAVLAALLLAGLDVVVAPRVAGDSDQERATRIFVVFAVPVILLVLRLAAILLSGLLSRVEQEEELEWYARAGALLFTVSVIWIALTGLGLFGKDIFEHVRVSVLAAVGFGAGYVGSMAGLSALTTSGLRRVKVEQLSKAQKWLTRHDALASVCCGISIVCIAFTLAYFTSFLHKAVESAILPAVLGSPKIPENLSELQKLKYSSWASLIVLGISAVLALLGNFFINVNTFSLHGLYRIRLTRAFLGASNFARHPDAFTNFDEKDDMPEAEMPCSPSRDSSPPTAPIHLINTALNVLATRNLAWQQRRAESFTFSPVSCGSWRLGYVPTGEYGGSQGVSLGTAMAISGAAFNPNMGHHSSPLVTFLMTFFNARLGWWLPNPLWPALQRPKLLQKSTRKFLRWNEPLRQAEIRLARKFPSHGEASSVSHLINQDAERREQKLKHGLLRKCGPSLALVPIINEALGNTDDTYKWIQLSDGGHFENLGLYEMVMRRCHSIIVVDCDADSDFHFEDLGNALRKIKIDLGVSIRFNRYPTGLPMSKDPGSAKVYCLEGTICYSKASGGNDEVCPDGTLVYIKPVLTGGEPTDVCAYHSTHPEFPHESTANQFFNEAQFESYRSLGDWAIRTITHEDGGAVERPGGCDMDTFLQTVHAYCKATEYTDAPSLEPVPEW